MTNLSDMTAEQKAKTIPTGYQQNAPYTDLEDIRQMMLTKARMEQSYYNDFTILNFRREDDLDGTNDGQEYYEVYKVDVTVTHDDCDNLEFNLVEKVVETERVVKEYKTLKGLIQGAVNHVRDNKNNQEVFTYLEL